MELCRDSLQRHLQARKWPVDERMQWAIQLVSGVSYMHSKGKFPRPFHRLSTFFPGWPSSDTRNSSWTVSFLMTGVLHRDLSTQNILLSSDHKIKIADFGTARKVNGRGTYNTSTIIGSPAYMAPEQIDARTMSLKTDMWAVGVNLWELATQKLPWAEEAMRAGAGQADLSFCKSIIARPGPVRMPRPAIGQLSPSVADEYYAMILSCHDKDPSLRPSSSALLSR
jgi:serine/threonine protein kinase